MFTIAEGLHIASPDEEVAEGIAVRLHPVGTKAKGWGWETDTRAAIEWLSDRCAPGVTVADVGTGTGILALVAAHMGSTVTAYESVEAVREIAQRNVQLNDVNVQLLGEYDGAQGFDLVVANLGDVEYGAILRAGTEVWTSG